MESFSKLSSLKGKVPKNIFQTPLSETTEMSEMRQERIRKKNLYKGYISLGISTMILAVYSVLFFYPQMSIYMSSQSTISSIENQIQEYNDVKLVNLEGMHSSAKKIYDNELDLVESNINAVFPENIDKLGLVKRLENFATYINAQTPPFEFNSISFSEPIQKDGYVILPISTSIHSSTTNFDKFIRLIDISGRLDSVITEKVRLMEISNVSIRYRGVDKKTGEDKGVDFSVKLNAYSRS